MTKMRRAIIGCLMGLVLLGAVVCAAPAAAAQENTQTMIVERDTAYYGDRKVTSDYRITRGTVVLGESTLTVSGDVYLDGGELRVCGGTLNVLGDLYVSSDLTFISGKINVSGDLIHKSGKLHVGSGDLYVADDYIMAVPKTDAAGETSWKSGSGKLTMQYSNADIVVGGDFYMDTVHGTNLEAGTLTVAGNFTQKDNHAPKKFVASQHHKVVLNGTEPQAVTMESEKSTFGKLVIANETSIVVSDYFSAHTLTSMVSDLKILSIEATWGSVTLDTPNAVIVGNVLLKGDLKLQKNTMRIEGHLIHSDGALLLDWGTLIVGGNYYFATFAGTNEIGEIIWEGSHGKLVMTSSKANMIVGGDFLMNAADGVTCTGGTLAVAGNFTQKVDYTPKKFVATQNHKVILNGTDQQTVVLESPDSTFCTLEIANDAGILVTDCFAATSLLSSVGEIKIQSEGAVFENLTLDVPLVTVTGDLILDGTLDLKRNRMNVEGDLYLLNGEELMDNLEVSGGCYTEAPEAEEEPVVIKHKFSSEESKTVKFTNKYGTPTTICAVSGCNKYIASSGDTNCCISHSKKCLNCGCYVDGDAAFCMSCITTALYGEDPIPFTNKYGTPTTKCYISDCTNYIAPIGDTNCCEYHSNNCLNCGCYVDWDASFCMQCITEAFGG